MNNQKLIEELKQTTVYKDRTSILTQIIQPLVQPNRSVDIEAYYVDDRLKTWGERYGGLELYPDFQRGNDWTQPDQIDFIQNLLRDNVDRRGKTLLINVVGFSEGHVETDIEHPVTILDGLQRYTAIQAFKNNEFTVFGGLALKDLERSKYHLSEIELHLAIYSFKKKLDLLKFYKMINQAGKVHSTAELARVGLMIDELEAAEA